MKTKLIGVPTVSLRTVHLAATIRASPKISFPLIMCGKMCVCFCAQTQLVERRVEAFFYREYEMARRGMRMTLQFGQGKGSVCVCVCLFTFYGGGLGVCVCGRKSEGEREVSGDCSAVVACSAVCVRLCMHHLGTMQSHLALLWEGRMFHAVS